MQIKWWLFFIKFLLMCLQMNKHPAGYFLKNCFEPGQCAIVVIILLVLRDKNFPYNFKFFRLAHITLNTGTRSRESPSAGLKIPSKSFTHPTAAGNVSQIDCL